LQTLYKGALEQLIGIIKRKRVNMRKERAFRVRDDVRPLAEKFLLQTPKLKMVQYLTSILKLHMLYPM
jgi:hypothetical protein